MDLAKIRKKHQRSYQNDSVSNSLQEIQTAGPDTQLSEPVIETSISPEIEIFNHPIPETGVLFPSAEIFSERVAVFRDPIEVILAGREAAGCDEVSPDDEETPDEHPESCLEYLCIRVSDEIYGVNIMDIKEITKPRKVTEIPRAPEFVSGIISLRGTIIPIIDMRSRLGLPGETVTGKERIVVIKNDQSFCGLSVDEVIQVVRINRESIEPAPSVLEGINRDFVSGIGRSDERLVIILNLESIADIHLY